MGSNSIFFSYSFKDEEKVLKVRKIIESIVDEEGNQKYSIFMASDPYTGNKTGRTWSAQERKVMLSSFLVFFFLSENSIVSDGVSQELDFYFNNMRKHNKQQKFLYMSLNGEKFSDAVFNVIQNLEEYVSDADVEMIVNKFVSIMDEPDFRDDHLFFKYDDVQLRERLQTTLDDIYDVFNKTDSIEEKKKRLLTQVANKKASEKEIIIPREIKEEIKEKKVDISFANIFMKNKKIKGSYKIENDIVSFFKQNKIKVEVIDSSEGDSFSVFEVKASSAGRIAAIIKLEHELRLALNVPSLRLVPSFTKEGVIEIEVPNAYRSPLMFGDILTQEFLNDAKRLKASIGRDVNKNEAVYDIVDMPHCLIAGATGSGKTNLIHTMIVSLLLKYSPKELNLVLFDPTRVVFTDYKNIPHLFYPIIYDARTGMEAFKKINEEMERRYKLLNKELARNIKNYNEIPYVEKLPYILIVIDEFIDFARMGSEMKTYITRLAQKSRAAGIHMIIATQRPTVDVITGDLKGNIPFRIATACVSYIDSKIILDQSGAEKLLGNGDALVKDNYNKLKRIQIAYINQRELTALCSSIQDKYGSGSINELIVEEESNPIKEDLEDPLLYLVGKFILSSQNASISRVQRFFGLGFNRSARLIDKLEELGVVSKQSSKGRKILVNEEEFEKIMNEKKGTF